MLAPLARMDSLADALVRFDAMLRVAAGGSQDRLGAFEVVPNDALSPRGSGQRSKRQDDRGSSEHASAGFGRASGRSIGPTAKRTEMPPKRNAPRVASGIL
jgi:hypothetical protein